jgi:lipoprotein-anchoring transpeptidase ErfK/SrfK
LRRILLVLAVVLVGATGVVAVVIFGGKPAVPPGPPPPPPPPVAVIAVTPATGSTGVVPTITATATVTDGTFGDVTLTDAKGEAVVGEFNEDRTSWSSTEPLEYKATYTWGGSATGTDGRAVPVEGTLATVAPSKTVRGTLNIGDGRTVGVAAPIRIQFNGHVGDRAAVEKALSLTTSVPVEGGWGWLPDEGGGSRVDYRPKEYWPAGTQVAVQAKLFGVAYGDGAYGATDLSSTFEIGRAQIVKADVDSFRMVVMRDGKKVGDYPASYGLGSDPERNTRSGVHVVSEKFTNKRMVSDRYGYDLVEKWAVRISNNGEFIHANPDSTSAQGSSNVTHGCVNLSPGDAKAYYDTALYGDPVEVTGTPVALASRDGDIWDWTLSWEQWKALSALDG